MTPVRRAAGALAVAWATTISAATGAAAGPAGPASAQTAPATAPAAAELLVDLDTGKVLFARNEHTPLPPASLTKVLTAMIAADWLPPASLVPVNAVAFNAWPDKVGMKPGQQWPLPIVMHALITDSANDAAYALAVDISGSLAGFSKVMAEAAAQIGMSDHPVLEDPAGLDGSEGYAGGNRISAWDLAVAARDFMANPALAAIAGEHTFDFEGPDGIAYHLRSRNENFLLTYPGSIGVKTGFTDRAGYCDIEEARRGGRSMLAVVLHSPNPDQVAAALLDQGFATPAAQEAAALPSLPPLAEPEPPSKVHATVATTATTLGRPPAPVAVVTPPARSRHHQYLWVDAVAVAVTAIGVVVFWRTRRLSRRKRPAAGHYRH